MEQLIEVLQGIIEKYQIEQQDAKRTNILRSCSRFGHHEDIFFGQRPCRG